MKTSNRLTLSASPSIQPARKLRSFASLSLRRRSIYGRERRCNAGKELDNETGLYYYGARYLDPKTSRWLSGDPAVGEYVPSAPVNEEAKKRNGNLPGMGGVFNYANLHVYHYAGNNPVKYVDPDGNYMGLKTTANNFKKVFSNRVSEFTGANRWDLTVEGALKSATNSDKKNARIDITRDSMKEASKTFDLKSYKEQQDYANNEITRYEAFAEIRGQDPASYDKSDKVLKAAENRYREAQGEAIGKRENRINANKYAENEANKIIDDFISNNNPNYIPPEPLK